MNDPFGFMGLYLRKIYFYFNNLESASNISPYLYQESSKILPYLLTHFSLFSSLGLIGVVLAIRNKEKIFLLHSYLIAMILSVSVFYVVARFGVVCKTFPYININNRKMTKMKDNITIISLQYQ